VNKRLSVIALALLAAVGNNVCNTPPLGGTAISPYRAKIQPPVELVVGDLNSEDD